MGCGEEARRESALAVRLLERFLRAGVETSGALKTLNSALTLRAEVSESFTTIDLLTLSLRDGAAEVYKYGAAPSYVKRGARVRRITGSCRGRGADGFAWDGGGTDTGWEAARSCGRRLSATGLPPLTVPGISSGWRCRPGCAAGLC